MGEERGPHLELRRAGRPDLADVGEDEGLTERIREEIRRTGPMPFARFMALALYDPDGGYYRSEAARPGREGDFLTAPELHPIFGACLARGLAQVWEVLGRPDPFVIQEHGAGTGALARAILDALAGGPLEAAVRYEPVEVDPRRIAAFRASLESAGHAAALAEPNEARSDAFEGVVLANEVLDALPVHRVRMADGSLRELAVHLDAAGALREVVIEPSTSAIEARLQEEGIQLVEGQTAEVCLQLDPWLRAATAGLRRGLVLLIDYAAPASELYDPIRRSAGTLRAYVRHTVHDDPYRHVGRQDLTAHVDTTAVETAAHALGLSTVGTTTQAEMLMGLGIEERLRAIQTDPATTLETYTLLRASLRRLLDPSAMGRFQVLGFGRDWPAGAPPLDLFAYRVPGRPGGPAPNATPPHQTPAD